MTSTKHRSIVYCGLLALFASSSFLLAKQSLLPSKINPGIIYYSISGAESGERKIVVNGSKMRVEHHSQLVIENTTYESKTLQIITEEFIYFFDLIAKTGIKQDNPRKYILPKLSSLDALNRAKVEKNLLEFGYLISEKRGQTLKILTNKEFSLPIYKNGVASKDAEAVISLSCRGYQLGDVEQYIVNLTENVPCSSHNENRKIRISALGVEPLAADKVSPSLFEVPKEYADAMSYDEQFKAVAKRLAETMFQIAASDEEMTKLQSELKKE